jgi:peptide methionine sulfoxide reductase msrA/msrB
MLLILAATMLFSATAHSELATLAGGCFWCMEPPFEKLEGVKSVTSGYSGGTQENPTYQTYHDRAPDGSMHTEVVQIDFDPKKISYKKILDVFWRNMDPTDSQGQFVDRGEQYRPGIFYHSDEQKKIAEESKAELEKKKVFKKPIVLEITKFGKFFAAEEYHQDYYKKNPVRYKYYRYRSGRDQFLEGVWGK